MGRKKKTLSPKLPPSIGQVTKLIPIPWNLVIKELLTREIKLFRKLDEAQKTIAQVILWEWDVALHWLIRWEWNSRHQVPATPKIRKLLKPQGEVLRRFFLLCERCHTLRGASVSYSHAAYWFGLVFLEQIYQQITEAIGIERSPKANRHKQRLIRKKKKFIAELRTLNNPFALDNEQREFCQKLKACKSLSACQGLRACPRLQASYDLIETAISIAEQPDADVFRKKYWLPLISALEKEVETANSRDFGVLSIDEGKAKLQVGQGRHKVVISPLW